MRLKRQRKPQYFYTGQLFLDGQTLVNEPDVPQGAEFVRALAREFQGRWRLKAQRSAGTIESTQTEMAAELSDWPGEWLSWVMKLLVRPRVETDAKLREAVPFIVDCAHRRLLCHFILRFGDDQLTCGVSSFQYFGMSWATPDIRRTALGVARTCGLFRVPAQFSKHQLMIGIDTWKGNVRMRERRVPPRSRLRQVAGKTARP